MLLQGTHVRWSPTGHVLVVRDDGALLAAPFDDEALELTGPAVPLLEGVDLDTQGSADLVISQNGTLAYVSGSSLGGDQELVWVSRSGVAQAIDPGWRGTFTSPRLSPDGDRLAMTILDANDFQIWVKQLDQGPLSKLSFQGTVSHRPNWHRTESPWSSDRYGAKTPTCSCDPPTAAPRRSS